MTAVHDTDPTAAVRADVTPGPRSTDEELLSWQQAASAGRLPEPVRDRWQQLRGGVVNMWEFDVEEYWCADGRAQFVGGNETGKSTLMTLTTLIMLAGNLDRSNIDTFGHQHKAFRYFLEAADGPKDRRDTSTQTNRGWAWVEYGRLVDGVPQYFTTLLYAQYKRGVKEPTLAWMTCTSNARVREEITLLRGQSVSTPSEVGEVPGLVRQQTGTAFKQAVASNLFGFTQPDRMESTIGMLKVLRTPQLGQRLDPTWFTDQMRQALPGIDRGEIDELAEGWDQLDRLARDRDSAGAARDAVKSYLKKAWKPWADAVLRRAADELAAATTNFDNVTRNFRDAETRLQRAQAALRDSEREYTAARAEWTELGTDYDTLIRSRAYLDAQSATDRVRQLETTAEGATGRSNQLADELTAARSTAERSAAQLVRAETTAREAEAAREAAAAVAMGAFTAAGLPHAAAWVASGDTDRLRVAATERRAHVAQLRRLIAATVKAEAEHAHQERRLGDAAGRETHRRTASAVADEESATSLQALSDDLETWSAALPEQPPTTNQRDAWIDAVTAEVSSPRPRAVLHARINSDWTAVVTEPLMKAAAVAKDNADQRIRAARDLDKQADARDQETDPTPTPPTGWLRRTRPPTQTLEHGAPLWRLLDPAPGVDDANLARLEAALAGAGLLDAWVSPDEVWLAARDGEDAVLTVNSSGPSLPAGRTLGSVLVAADDIGPLAGPVADLLTRVGHTEEPGHLDGGAYAVAADGRWRTPVTSGRAAPEHEGASLLGAAARAGARARQVAALRHQAQALHAEADQLLVEAAELTGRASALRTAADAAPLDDDVVSTATAAATAAVELERAATDTARARDAARDAETAANNARAAQHEFAGDHQLPVDETLEDVAIAIDTASSRAGDLKVAARDLTQAQERRDETTERAADDEVAAGLRQELAAAAAETARLARVAHETARAHLGASEQELLARASRLSGHRDQAREKADRLQEAVSQQNGNVGKAEEALKRHDDERERADSDRATALEAWWAPVDAGLAAARGLEEASGRSVTPALAQARQAREKLVPRRWPAARESRAERDAFVSNALSAMVGRELVDLNVVLEATGGRTAAAFTSEDPHVLPQITVLVDASGMAVDPVTAVTVLDAKAAELAQLHDEKLHNVLEELLSSTFVEHLRDRMGSVLILTDKVNEVLAAHPTGARQTVLRLSRVPAHDQADGYRVLDSLVDGFVDSPAVQEEVRRFLERQIRDAQALGAETGTEWKEHLATLLDYRRWFDVITEFKVLADERKRPWKALTKEIHGQDSGGAKVVTLLQPLLATLVAMYDECQHAPRPLWLDEAFEGVDADNRSTMLDLFVDFDLDFLLAGPGTLVASAQVPSAAVWYVHKAPGADPGVSLSLMLWAGNMLTPVNTTTPVWHEPARADGEPEEGLWE